MISLSDRQWKQFKIGSLFKIVRGKRIPKRSRHDGNIPFVGASTINNGITDYINQNGVSSGYHKNVIGVNYNGAPCYAFYHPYLAYFCDDVMTLTKKYLNPFEAMFITTCITQQNTQFSYGFKLKTDRLRNLKINLPTDSNGKPDWDFMTNYMKQVRDKIPKQNIHNTLHHAKYDLNDKSWKQFKIKDIGKIISSSDYPVKSRTKGNLPFIGSSSENNGITDYITKTNNTPNKFYKNVISVNRNGSVGYAFYHPYTAYFSGDTRVLFIKGLTRFVALFITACISQQKHLFSFGFKLGKNRLENLKINLPVDNNGKPDWEFMNNYMKSMLN